MYVEYYAIENLLVNYIIISCTAIISKNNSSMKKKWTGATIGMIYSILYLFDNFNLFFSIPMKVLLILIVTKIAFNILYRPHTFNYIFYNLNYIYKWSSS